VLFPFFVLSKKARPCFYYLGITRYAPTEIKPKACEIAGGFLVPLCHHPLTFLHTLLIHSVDNNIIFHINIGYARVRFRCRFLFAYFLLDK
jgi:hypothetical protein